MKLTKKLLLLSASLILTACGPDTSIPRGYSEVKIENASDLADFQTKLSNALAKTETKEADGCKVEISFDVDELSLIKSSGAGLLSSKSGISIKDFNFDLSMAIKGSTKSLNDLVYALELDGLDFTIESYSSSSTSKTVAKDIDFSMYIANGNLYYDASDKDLKNFLYSVIDSTYSDLGAISGASNVDVASYIENMKANIDLLLGKKYIKNIAKILGDIDISGAKDVIEDSAGININFDKDNIFTDPTISNLLTFALDKNSDGVAIGISSEKLDLSSLASQVDKLDCDFEGALVFDKNGLFDRFGFECDFNYSSAKSSLSTIGTSIVVDDLQVAIDADYDVNPKLPNFDNYQLISSDLISGILESINGKE